MLGSTGVGRPRRAAATLLAAVAALVAVGGLELAPPARAQELPTDPADVLELFLQLLDQIVPDDLPDPIDQTDPLNPACDPLDQAMCLLPFPSDRWTVADPSTATGLRVDLPLVGMPRNIYGKPIDPAEWNRNDGFSPGSMLITLVPGLDLVETWGLGDRPERYQAELTDPALSLAADSPMVLVDADTGERHPFFAELDGHPDTPSTSRALIVRPAVNLLEGHRYVIGLRNLLDSSGDPIAAGAAFAALRDGTAGGDRQSAYDDRIFPVLAAAGVEREDLYLAWDLTIASADNLAGRVLAMRDQTFTDLGDTDLDDGLVQGDAPSFAIESVMEPSDPADSTGREVRGTVAVPNYLSLPDDLVVSVPEVGDFPVPGARLVYDSLLPGPDDTPIVNALDPVRNVDFVCSIPRAAFEGDPAVPTLYGHGLLGSRNESVGGSTGGLRANGHMPCSVDWTGMSSGDLLNVATILQDISLFPSLADRAQQGFLDFLVLGRALSHPDGLASNAAFQDDAGEPLFDPSALVYDGNSQGAIMGGALTALGVDFTRSVLGVPGMNYSMLLNRSLDWEGAYGELEYAFYPNKLEQQLVFGLIQMLWDRGEANGFAQHMTDDPLPNTPAKQVLLQVGYSDHQVTNLAAEVEARTIGAARIPTDLPVCRHWAVDPMFGFVANDPSAPLPAVLSYYDSGTPRAPLDNNPSGRGDDPHEDPRRDPAAIEQKITFYETGRVIDANDGAHARSHVWPEKAGDDMAEVQADLTDDCLEATSAPAPPVVTPAPTPDPAAAPNRPDRLPATGGPSPLPVALTLLLAAGAVRVGLRRVRVRG